MTVSSGVLAEAHASKDGFSWAGASIWLPDSRTE